HRVGGGAEDHVDAVGVGGIQHLGHPRGLELPVLRLPGAPRGLPYPDHAESGLLHQTHVLSKPGCGLVLVVVGGPEADRCAHRVRLAFTRSMAALSARRPSADTPKSVSCRVWLSCQLVCRRSRSARELSTASTSAR